MENKEKDKPKEKNCGPQKAFLSVFPLDFFKKNIVSE
jgi:hypothetical protein